LVDSQNEITILDEMEKAMGDQNYADCILYARKAVQYHTELMRLNTMAPTFYDNLGYRDILAGVQSAPRYGIRTLDYRAERYFDEVNKAIKYLLDRNLFPDHYDEIEQLLDPWGLHSKPPDKEQAEQMRIRAYDIITRTQWRLKKLKDRKGPIIFDLRIKTRGDKKVVLIGVASISEISELKLKFSQDRKNEYEINSSPKIGLQEIEIDPKYSVQFNELRITVIDVNNKNDASYLKLK